jgi:thiazole synthase ThiGH ThiG subunit
LKSSLVLYTLAYISLDYVLQNEGVVFQYDTEITTVSYYLSRSIKVENHKLRYRKIKHSVLLNTAGIRRLNNGINIATAERAMLDSLYLNKSGYFDNIEKLDVNFMKKMLKTYQSKTMENLFNQSFKNV